MTVRNAGHYAAVIEVYDRAVITHIPVFQEQVSEVRTPFLVGAVCREVLFELVFKHLVGLSRLGLRLPRGDRQFSWTNTRNIWTTILPIRADFLF